MKWSCVWLLLAVLPSLSSAAAFNWRRHLGQFTDRILRFEPIKGRQDGSVVTKLTDQPTAGLPPFCNKLDCPKFEVLKKEKTFELRQYVKTGWVSTDSIGVDYSKASYEDFMLLFDYIQGANVKHETINMTAPVINRILPGQGPACANNFTMSFFVSPKEDVPPKPSDKAVYLSNMPVMKVYVRAFPGRATKDKWLTEGMELAEDLKNKGAKFHEEFYYTAGYNSPFQLTGRHNEIWFIAK
ncbi:hypothetical protein ACOMHN_013661 [Nucella lapillus]